MFFSDKHAGMGELADTLAEDAYTEGRSLWRAVVRGLRPVPVTLG